MFLGWPLLGWVSLFSPLGASICDLSSADLSLSSPCQLVPPVSLLSAHLCLQFSLGLWQLADTWQGTSGSS